ncbi:ras family small GTPase [Naegleria gruberi]|uniref:Ras family small GTPase n=1 Tax=Naegleria gruberi TaxID=5762 RepID=D2VMT0_NAEGR|nr:ras family small GTPase [Naegleria gruberi]EFC41788.1 ras family small GTPase [Naegleria gruberi]|eukprot:XP_002674532.1 ras family small GTPase [Naegleria gruberi strain NEG-M]
MKLLELPDEIIFHILGYCCVAAENHHEPLLRNPYVRQMAKIQSINKDFSRRIKSYSDTFWKSLLVDEFGANKQFIKLIDDQITGTLQNKKISLKRRALLLRKLFSRNFKINTNKQPGYSECKFCVSGPANTGKTCLTTKYITGEFPQVTDPTIEDSYRKMIRVDEYSHLLDILDTAGQEEYKAMRDGYIATSQAFVITASLDLIPTECTQYYEELLAQIISIKDWKGVGCYHPMVFVVNKSDLEQEERKSTFEEWKTFLNSVIERYGIMNSEIIETSAKSNINVSKIFELGIRMFLHFHFSHVFWFQQVIELDTKAFSHTENKSEKKCLLQ